ncbi:diphosphomevalonate decarboxylase, partial [Candidatus Micrarchaeota archaeon]|nr:diphosphomevalonate decarboxylase [Candidatus Micrarchaeota archaeon]
HHLSMHIATVETTPNIALVKYWGKRDEKLMLPMNSSISVTLSDEVKTRTTVMFSDKFRKDEVYLDEKQVAGKELGNVVRILDIVRKKARVRLRAKVVSMNYFPTAAGLASSASGFAALACASTKALKLRLSRRELSILARLGSGSASRSVEGGFVEWLKGKRNDGQDSYGRRLAGQKHWPELRNVIAIVNREKKKVASRAGMKTTVETSSLYGCRLGGIEKTLATVRKSVKKRDSD